MRHPPTVRLAALACACLVSLGIGLLVQCAWRWLTGAVWDESAVLASLQTSAIVEQAVVPAVGNGIGYFMSYRRRSRRSRMLFAGPSALLAGVGLAVGLAQLPPSPGWRAVVVTVVIVSITPIVTMTVLLTQADRLRRDPVAAGGVPPVT